MATIKTLLNDNTSVAKSVKKQLLLEILNQNSSFLIAHDDYVLNDSEQQDYDRALKQLAKGMPLAYVVGHQGFWKLDFVVNEHTLIPRPDTELLIETVLQHYQNSLSKNLKVLDLGTGSGCIAISLAHECPAWQVTAVDVSLPALAVARENAQQHNIDNINFVHSHWFEAISADNPFDIILSNPPYIDANDAHLVDLQDEPMTALVAGANGLADINHLIQYAPAYLVTDGLLILEHGYDQGEAVRQLFIDNGFCQVSTLKDYGGNERVTLGILSQSDK